HPDARRPGRSGRWRARGARTRTLRVHRTAHGTARRTHRRPAGRLTLIAEYADSSLQVPEVPLRRLEERPLVPHQFEVVVVAETQPPLPDLEDLRAGQRREDWRMRRQHDLQSFIPKVPQGADQCETP